MSIKSSFNLDRLTDVVWIQTAFIGDITLTTAAIAYLRRAAPRINQHLITTPVGAALLKDHPDLAGVHVFAKRSGILSPILRARAALRPLPKRTTITLQPHKSPRSTLLSLSLGYPVITYEETAGSWLASATVPRVATLHEADRIALLLEPLGFDRRSLSGLKPTLRAGTTPPDRLRLSDELRWIAIAPGSVWPTKRWPVEKFASLAHLLADMSGFGIALLGSADENGFNEFIEKSLLKSRPGAKDRIKNLSGQTSIDELKALYPRLSLLISNDSSPVHFAAAFDIPTIAIFGATMPSMGFAPLARASKVIDTDLPCRPCSDHGPVRCPLTHFNCMNQIPVERVFEAARDILESR